MNVDQALHIFRDVKEDKRDALQWTLDHWEEASDRLLSKLRGITANLADDINDERFNDSDASALFYLVHLFAEKRDQRAYGPLCDRLIRDKDYDAWLGDSIGESLAQVLISLYDGDIEPIQRVIEAAGADEYVRGAALDAFSYLVRFGGAMSDEAARDYLRRLLDQAEPRRQSWLWASWADGVARLGLVELKPDVARLFSKSWIEDDIMTIQDFHGLLAEGQRDPQKAFERDRLRPFGSTIELEESYMQAPQSSAEQVDPASIFHLGGTYKNDMRDVGRNDPCPCGSGKKYKKCCLAA